MLPYLKSLFVLALTFIQTVSFSQWTLVLQNSSNNLRCIRFFDTSTGIIAGFNGTILITTNGGVNWSAQISNTSENLMDICFVDRNTGYIAGTNCTILKTTNGGINWQSQSGGVYQHLHSASFINSNTGTCVGGWINNPVIIHTTDGGQYWYEQQSSATKDLFAVSLLEVNIGMIGGLNTLLLTTNGGINWIDKSTAVNNITCGEVLVQNPNVMWFVGSNGTILKTTDSGQNWVNTFSVQTNYFLDITFIDINTGYTVGFVGRILKTSNGGSNWTVQNTPTTEYVYGINFLNVNTGYAVCERGVLKTTNGGDPIGIKPANNNVADEFSLSQNYPNPFNPDTKINFEVPHISFVQITIYDVNGRMLTRLVDEQLAPGIYQVEWDAAGFASGVYYYNMRADNFSAAKKMILIK